MAKAKRQKKKVKGGPYLAAACFCESILEDKLGTISAIRIIDQIAAQMPSHVTDFPTDQNRLVVPVSALVILRTGYSPGEHRLQFVVTSPSGKKERSPEQTVNLTPQEHGGFQIISRMNFGVFKGGLFWVDVILDDKRITRMPIRIEIQRAESLQASPEGEAGAAQS
jgi:hypothetical protein